MKAIRTFCHLHISLCALLVTGAAACTDGTKSPTDPAPDPAGQLKALREKITVDTASAQPVRDERLLTGKIQPDEDKQISIYPQVSGVVSKVYAHTNHYVKAGEVLAEMTSAEMAGYNSEFAANEAALSNARRRLSAVKDMFHSGLSSEKELEEAENEFKRTNSEWKKAKEVLQLNGGGSSTRYLIRTPLKGFVIKRGIAEHMQLRADNADPAFVVADISRVWAVVNVYESDISAVHQGDSVELTTIAYRDKVFTGRIEKIYQVLDAETKTMRARISVDNAGLLLKPEMFVSAKVTSNYNDNRISIPARDLIFDDNHYYVICIENKGMRIQPVEVAEKIGDRAYIVSGLKEGDLLAGSRQLYIYQSLKD